jgi:hypothetical protein
MTATIISLETYRRGRCFRQIKEAMQKGQIRFPTDAELLSDLLAYRAPTFHLTVSFSQIRVLTVSSPSLRGELWILDAEDED